MPHHGYSPLYKSHVIDNSPEWQAIKRRLAIHRPRRCRACGTWKNVQAHHLTYKRLGREKNRDLMWLCEKHHNTVTFLHKRIGIGNRTAAWLVVMCTRSQHPWHEALPSTRRGNTKYHSRW